MINQRLLHNIKTLSNHILDGILEGNRDRSRIIMILNEFYKQLYIRGVINGLCKVSVTSGRPEYATSNSALRFRSGIEINITNPMDVTEEEAVMLVQFILFLDPKIVRNLISMGFDTWRGKLGDNPNTWDLRLADFINYQPLRSIGQSQQSVNTTTPKVITAPTTYTPAPQPVVTPTIQRKKTEFNGNLYNN